MKYIIIPVFSVIFLLIEILFFVVISIISFIWCGKIAPWKDIYNNEDEIFETEKYIDENPWQTLKRRFCDWKE